MPVKWRVFDYIDSQGRNVMLEWANRLPMQKTERAKLNSKIDLLERVGLDLAPGILADTGNRHIKKLRVRGKVQLRPMLCLGPIILDSEFTFLQGAIEKDYKLIPPDATDRAEENRSDLLAHPGKRCGHERFS
jgi:hypothetical protein